MKLSSKVKKMSFGQRGQEIKRLERSIKRFVKLKDNELCHIELKRLARSIGLRPAKSNIDPNCMLKNCRNYIKKLCNGKILKGELNLKLVKIN